MTAAEFQTSGEFFLEAHEVTRFVLSEIAPVGQRAGGVSLQVPPPAVLGTAIKLIDTVLMWVREYGGQGAVDVNSWFRDEEYNHAVGGTPSSMHMTGGASDINKRGWAPVNLARVIHLEHPASEQLGIGCYKTFVHVDIRGLCGRTAPARWGTPSNWWMTP